MKNFLITAMVIISGMLATPANSFAQG